jgi:hypothetical protein
MISVCWKIFPHRHPLRQGQIGHHRRLDRALRGFGSRAVGGLRAGNTLASNLVPYFRAVLEHVKNRPPFPMRFPKLVRGKIIGIIQGGAFCTVSYFQR